MCYSGFCCYETYDGGCRKPRRIPCPQDEEEVEAYEIALEWEAESRGDEMRDLSGYDPIED